MEYILKETFKDSYSYQVYMKTGEVVTMSEHDILADDNGLKLFDDFVNKKHKRLQSVKTAIALVNSRIEVKIIDKWICGTVIFAKHPYYTVKYDDGFEVGPDKLLLPWRLEQKKKKRKSNWPPRTMNCKQCSTKLKVTANYCSSCGASQIDVK